MLALEHWSRKAVVGLSISIHLSPFSWVLFVEKDWWRAIKWLWIMPGAILTELLRMGLTHFQMEMSGGVWMLVSFLFSSAMMTIVVLWMFWTPRARGIIAFVALLYSLFFSWAAYGLYQS